MCIYKACFRCAAVKYFSSWDRIARLTFPVFLAKNVLS